MSEASKPFLTRLALEMQHCVYAPKETLPTLSEDELAWPLPLLPAFEEEMTGSKIADVRNLGKDGYGGACTAAAFLKQFVPTRGGDGDGDEAEKQIPWAHLDIAGTACPSDFCRALFQIEHSAFHSYGIDTHACGVLCDVSTGGASSNAAVEHGASGVMVRTLHRMITVDE